MLPLKSKGESGHPRLRAVLLMRLAYDLRILFMQTSDDLLSLYFTPANFSTLNSWFHSTWPMAFPGPQRLLRAVLFETTYFVVSDFFPEV